MKRINVWWTATATTNNTTTNRNKTATLWQAKLKPQYRMPQRLYNHNIVLRWRWRGTLRWLDLFYFPSSSSPINKTPCHSSLLTNALPVDKTKTQEMVDIKTEVESRIKGTNFTRFLKYLFWVCCSCLLFNVVLKHLKNIFFFYEFVAKNLLRSRRDEKYFFFWF